MSDVRLSEIKVEAETIELLQLLAQLIMIQTRNLERPVVPPPSITGIKDAVIRAVKTATFFREHLKKHMSAGDKDAISYLYSHIRHHTFELMKARAGCPNYIPYSEADQNEGNKD
jgi:hypothetical protein